MKGIKIECEIVASNGDVAKLGDIIIVTIPELYISGGEYTDGIYLSEKKLKAELMLQPSRGLLIKILEIIEEDSDDDSNIFVGKTIPFRRFAWDWYVTDAMEEKE